jgi:hypothetical protein
MHDFSPNLHLDLWPELQPKPDPTPVPTAQQPVSKSQKTGRSGSGLSTRINVGPPPPPPEPSTIDELREQLKHVPTSKLRELAGGSGREPVGFEDM